MCCPPGAASQEGSSAGATGHEFPFTTHLSERAHVLVQVLASVDGQEGGCPARLPGQPGSQQAPSGVGCLSGEPGGGLRGLTRGVVSVGAWGILSKGWGSRGGAWGSLSRGWGVSQQGAWGSLGRGGGLTEVPGGVSAGGGGLPAGCLGGVSGEPGGSQWVVSQCEGRGHLSRMHLSQGLPG